MSELYVHHCLCVITEELPSFEDQLHSLFKVVHVGPISTGIQSLMLLHQVLESRHSVSDRYYNALYSKLMDPALKHCNRQVYIPIVFRLFCLFVLVYMCGHCIST